MLDLNQYIGTRLNLLGKGQSKTNVDVTLMDELGGGGWLVSLTAQDAIYGGINVDQHFTLRFEERNIVHLLKVVVKKVSQYPFPHLHLHLSEDSVRLIRRKSTRIPLQNTKLKLDIKNDVGDDLISMIDISTDGAQLLSSNRLGRIDDKFTISVSAPQKSDSYNFTCHVRYVLTEIDKISRDKFVFRHGVKFTDLDMDTEFFLQCILKENSTHQFDAR